MKFIHDYKINRLKFIYIHLHLYPSSFVSIFICCASINISNIIYNDE